MLDGRILAEKLWIDNRVRNSTFCNPNVITDSSKDHQWMSQLGARFWGTRCLHRLIINYNGKSYLYNREIWQTPPWSNDQTTYQQLQDKLTSCTCQYDTREGHNVTHAICLPTKVYSNSNLMGANRKIHNMGQSIG